jgi:hypothetical protein
MEEYAPTSEVSSEFRVRELPEKISTNLDLQEVIPSNAFVVHLMVGVIRIATALILNECKPTSSVNEIRVDFNLELG